MAKDPTLGPIPLDDQDSVQRVLANSVLGLWDVVNNLTRLRPTKRDRFSVTIFGSARAKPGSVAYEETKQLAQELSKWGCDIITGGGPGLMQAANEGAYAANGGGRSVGIRVDLPFEQNVNAFVSQAFEHRTFFTRLHQFVLVSDAFVVAPGGIGTALEVMMIWQLLQVKHLTGVPLILVGDMWKGLIRWVQSSMLAFDPPLIDAADVHIPQCTTCATTALELLREHFNRWNESKSGGDLFA